MDLEGLLAEAQSRHWKYEIEGKAKPWHISRNHDVPEHDGFLPMEFEGTVTIPINEAIELLADAERGKRKREKRARRRAEEA